MSQFSHLGGLLYGRPHFMTQEALASLHEGYQAHLRGAGGSADVGAIVEEATQLLSKFSAFSFGGKSLVSFGGEKPSDGRDASGFHRIGNVAIISMSGIIARDLPMMKRLCSGGCDLNRVDLALQGASDAEDITDIVLFANSPGGSATGTPKTAAHFLAIGEKKKTYAFTNGECSSAAYYIASQARQVYCSQSAWLGSIGTRAIFLDETMKLAGEGVKVNSISAGKWKTAGASWKEMSSDERAMFTALVDQLNTAFRSTVAAARPQIEAASMEGQCFIGAKAVDAGLSDGLIDSLDALVSDLLLQDATDEELDPEETL